jgi:hypothetical protein
MPVQILQKLVMTIDEGYPILEYLILAPPLKDKSTASILPQTLQLKHHVYVTSR